MLRRLTKFYVDEHYRVLPHAALRRGDARRDVLRDWGACRGRAESQARAGSTTTIDREPAYKVWYLSACARCCREGGGVTSLEVENFRDPRSRGWASMYSFTLPVATREFTVSLLWHPRLEADPAHRWLRGCVREVKQLADSAAVAGATHESLDPRRRSRPTKARSS